MLLTRIAPFRYQLLPLIDAERIIQFQRRDGRATNAGFANNESAEQFKMLVPNLRSWVEERRDFIINRVQRGDFSAFVFVAFEAGERQVDEDRCAVVFARDDVVYLMGKIRIVLMQ